MFPIEIDDFVQFHDRRRKLQVGRVLSIGNSDRTGEFVLEVVLADGTRDWPLRSELEHLGEVREEFRNEFFDDLHPNDEL